MSAEPDRESPGLDRPLTVPLLVRGAVDPRVMLPLAFVAFILVCIALNEPHRRTSDGGSFWFWSALAAGVAVPAALLTIWFLPRRRWIEVTLTGFVLTERRRRRAYADDEVVGLTRSFTVDSNKVVHHHVVVELRPDGRKIDCLYAEQVGLGDPLAGLWVRLVGGVARRVGADLDSGATLAGEGWRLDAEGLHWRQGRLPLSRITKVGYYNRKLCLWKDDDERAFLRLPAGSRNAQPLGSLLWELRPDPAAARLPGKPLGRVLLELRSLDWVAGVAMLFLGLVLLYPLARWMVTRPGALPALATLAWLTVFVSTSVYSFEPRPTARLLFHEHGVSQPGPGGGKALLHEQIGTVTWKAGLAITFRPAAGVELPEIEYVTAVSRDVDVAPVRDLVCARLAQRWAEELRAGPVRWTPRLRFLPGSLEYTPGGLLGPGEPVAVPFEQTSFQLDNGAFRLFIAGHARAVFKERTDGPNFFVGLVLLQMIYRSCQQAQERQPSAAPAPPLRKGRGITLPGPPPGHITPG
jgi:hypothetical protein